MSEKVPKEIFFSILNDWRSTVLGREGIPREIEGKIHASLGTRPIKVISGFRRSGKSFLVQRLAKRLIHEKTLSLKNLLYLNFEDYRLSDVTSAADLGELFDIFLSIADPAGRKFIILDEIQRVARWEQFIRTIHEQYDDIEIILTGSNSDLLSSEIASRLAGRHIDFFVLPFSLRESLLLKGVGVQSDADYYTHEREIARALETYLEFGGLPETLLIDDLEARQSYVHGVLNKVILDDIIKRYRVEQVELYERIIAYLLATPGQIISFTSIMNRLQSQGFKIKAETIISYISYAENALAVFGLKKFSWKAGRVLASAAKYYSIDCGLTNLFTAPSENRSFRLENAVFLELVRRFGRAHVAFSRDEANREIDFLVINDNRRVVLACQVCNQLTVENRARELTPFVQFSKHVPGCELMLIGDERESESEKFDGVSISRCSISRFLLGLF